MNVPLYARPQRVGGEVRQVPTFAAYVDGRRTRRVGTIVAPEGSVVAPVRLGGPLVLTVPLGITGSRSVALEADEALARAKAGDYRLSFAETVP